MYSTQTFKNPSLIKRFSHNKRFYLSLNLIKPRDNDSILDYGTGDGHILNQLRKENSICDLSGFEPIQKVEINEKSIKMYDNIKNIDTTFNKITCFEVMEHLTYENQKKELRNIMSLLDSNGIIILSVPIENGFSSLIKNTMRILLKQKHPNTSVTTMFKSLLVALPFLWLGCSQESQTAKPVMQAEVGIYTLSSQSAQSSL